MYKTLLGFCMLLGLQLNAQNEETCGNPTAITPVNSYNGWSTNAALIQFSGNAQVDNQEPCSLIYSSGSGNVYFSNSAGIFFEATFNNASSFPVGGYPRVLFSMYNYDITASTNALVVEYSIDGGNNYITIHYTRYNHPSFQSGLWFVVEGVSSELVPPGISSYKIRFRQTSTTRNFRIDDIYFGSIVPLPLSLINFSVSKGTITWSANSSSSNEVFNVEKSTNGRDFYPIHSLNAKGSGIHSYNYTDNQTNNPKTYYRILLKNQTGQISYSKTLLVQSIEKGFTITQIPVRDIVQVNISTDLSTLKSLRLYDIYGREMKRFNAKTGSQQLDVSNVPQGKYLLQLVTTKGEVYYRQVMKL